MREIVFDTETTGLSFSGGDRLVEIGCVELVNKVMTGRHYHVYLNPERPVPVEAFRVHGLSDVFLSDKPLFRDVVEDLIDFIGDSPMIAHNANFDFGFINGEMTRCGRPIVSLDRMVDTLVIARTRHPGAKHTLDALCSRYGIDLSARTLHGALLDAQLLAQVYVELTGGRQISMGLAVDVPVMRETAAEATSRVHVRPARHFAPSEAELERHAAFLKKLEEPIWGQAASG
ncbi:DNA polymerase III subunit epsilon [Sphingomonas sp. G-3-2-10]|uniref:DNA polymerase III subunit epsilon n=1 Tax=Sphingomonas sp. G-3-2-10 TaxID=2728838 RepID=UPI00146B7839|nr:DNA polymerase III subunit epsilon [Sphingomonas sp. G-3-2-10]NML07351.1 DNA polymerase III subunit epsilon [Sphingomonas sp. G-3-2-10]